MDDVDAVVGQGQRLGVGRDDHRGCRVEPGAREPRAGPGDEGEVRLDPDDAGAAGREAREVEPGAAPDVEQVGAGQGMHRVDGGVDDPGAVGRAVLQLVDVRGVPDVRAADHDEVAVLVIRGSS